MMQHRETHHMLRQEKLDPETVCSKKTKQNRPLINDQNNFWWINYYFGSNPPISEIKTHVQV